MGCGGSTPALGPVFKQFDEKRRRLPANRRAQAGLPRDRAEGAGRRELNSRWTGKPSMPSIPTRTARCSNTMQHARGHIPTGAMEA
eukprot:scaffold102085_cov63-Phaeocystis_antarctica.AAC.1